jgi:SAM-dependent methyltransferase
MRYFGRLLGILTLVTCVVAPIGVCLADSCESTRVANEKQHVRKVKGGYPYREKSDYVLRELDLKPGDVVADIGAGDGWWAEKMAPVVGEQGVIHAGEVAQDKVDKMKKKLADVPQVRPYLCPLDGTGLPEDSCDLVFFSKSYHHLDKDGQVDYLNGLRSVAKPTGRLVVIEHYQELATGRARDHAWSPGLLTQQAEEGGWVLARSELIKGTNHFIAVFVQKDLFGIKEPEKELAGAGKE